MNLYEIAELSFNQIFPKSGGKAPVDLVEFQRTAYGEFALQSLLMARQESLEEGYFEVPSYLLTSVEKEVVDNEMDISDLKYFKSLPMEVWLQNIGGANCHCKYVKSSLNLTQLLCDDDSLDDEAKPYYPLGKKLIFPKGTHASTLTLIYANMGEGLDGTIEVDEAIGAIIRERLASIYLGKLSPADVTNNQNPNG